MDAEIRKFVEAHNDKNVEIECRFREGHNGIMYDTFTHVYNLLVENKDFTKAHPRISQVYAMKHKKSQQTYRYTMFANSSVFETKTRIAMHDFKEYNFKIAASSEKKIYEPDNSTKKNYIVTNVREKVRYSFYNSNVTIDLTNVFQNNNERIYEIECELLSSNVEYFITVLKMLLRYIQRSEYIISNETKRKLMQEYATLCGQKIPRFIGPLPYTISKAQFDNGVLSCNYAVTDKADGLRKLFFVNSKGDGLLISRGSEREIYVGNMFAQMKNSLFDGELVDKDYYIFDCMYINSKNVQNENLYTRLSYVKLPTISASVVVQSKGIKLHVKEFFYNSKKIVGKAISNASGSVYTHAYKIWNSKESKPYTLDGLIFTPVNMPYYNEHILKWKPTDTIDFYITKTNKTSTTETWTLHIAGFDKGVKYKHYTFRGFDGRGSISYKKGQKLFVAKNNIPFAFGTLVLENSIAEKYKDKSVIEFKFQKNKQRFMPIQTREDKTFANGVMAVNDAYNSIINPITLNALKNGKYIYCGRKYHNVIKNHLIQKYFKGSTVLDIGVGAGGNIMKYTQANVKKLVGVNIVPIQYQYNTSKMTFYHITNTNMYNMTMVLKDSKIKMFDNVACFFAIHYFFKSDAHLKNFYNNVNKSLAPGGYLVCTFMDGKNILDLLNNKTSYESNVFTLKRNSDRIQVMLKGTKYFETDASKEFIVDTQKLLKMFSNFTLIEYKGFNEYKSKFASEYSLMSNEEQLFSNLNVIMVLRKKM